MLTHKKQPLLKSLLGKCKGILFASEESTEPQPKNLLYTQPYSISGGSITRLEVTEPESFSKQRVYQAKPIFVADDALHYYSRLSRMAEEYGYCLFPNVSTSMLINLEGESDRIQRDLPYFNFVVCDRHHFNVLNAIKLTKGLYSHPLSEADEYLCNEMFMSDISLHHIEQLPFVRNSEINRVFIDAEQRLTDNLSHCVGKARKQPASLLNESEQTFYKAALDQIEDFGYLLFTKASLEAFIEVSDSINDHLEAAKHWGSLRNKTADFVICDPVTLQVLACCNLGNKDDQFEQSALLMANIPLYKIHQDYMCSSVAIAAMLEDISDFSLPKTSAQSIPNPVQTNAPLKPYLEAEVA